MASGASSRHLPHAAPPAFSFLAFHDARGKWLPHLSGHAHERRDIPHRVHRRNPEGRHASLSCSFERDIAQACARFSTHGSLSAMPISDFVCRVLPATPSRHVRSTTYLARGASDKPPCQARAELYAHGLGTFEKIASSDHVTTTIVRSIGIKRMKHFSQGLTDRYSCLTTTA